MKYFIAAFIILLSVFTSCNRTGGQQEDELYSRHLQRKVKLTIINTPVPADKSELNLLIFNDGNEIHKLRLKEILDSLYKKKLITPVVAVAIHAGDRMQEYGVAGKPDYEGRGSKAEYYSRFIDNELYFYAKKKSGVRKFKSVAIAGCSLGGLSAFDIAWNHADKIDKVGVFSGSFWWRDKDTKDSSYKDEKNRIMHSVLQSSRKRPKLQYWFYCGAAEETSDRDKDGINDVIDDTGDIITLLKEKKNIAREDIVYKESAGAKHDWPYWSEALPGFLIWAFGRKSDL
ncbi:MAG: alpha/beta hydrolase-fold protein [Chitinophagaceae bacterium]|nr:alpha/beta hydrolase-fold protein [Chitinophagaceae bacterium]